jgi:hypothetical protein
MTDPLKLYHNMAVLTPMGEGLVEGRTACAEPPKVFVRIPVDNLPPEMRTALQARHLTCVMLEFDLDSLVPVMEGKKITRVPKGKATP